MNTQTLTYIAKQLNAGKDVYVDVSTPDDILQRCYNVFNDKDLCTLLSSLKKYSHAMTTGCKVQSVSGQKLTYILNDPGKILKKRSVTVKFKNNVKYVHENNRKFIDINKLKALHQAIDFLNTIIDTNVDVKVNDSIDTDLTIKLKELAQLNSRRSELLTQIIKS
jgi:hypothetical protein